MNKRVSIFGLLLSLWISVPVHANAANVTPNARASVLLDGGSGQVLYDSNGLAINYPASTTKLLTALVAVEHGNLNQTITVSEHAVDQPPDSSSCYLESGEQQSLENLLYGLLLASGNDCAIAIAEGVGGTQEQFILWMNEVAKRLGATRSQFTNPHGLHDPEHYTTAQDLALIARGALANPTVLKIAGTTEFFWPGKSERNGVYYNHNQMLWSYDGAIGGKTGFTEQAGLTLVSAARRGDRLLIGVIMGERFKSEQYQEMNALLDFGFAEFEQRSFVQEGQDVGFVAVEGGKQERVRVATGSAFLVSAPKGGPELVQSVPVLKPKVAAPVTVGQELGHLEVREGTRVIGTVPVIAVQDVQEAPFTLDIVLNGSLEILKWIAYVFGGLLLFRTSVKAIRRRLRRGRQRSISSRPHRRLTGTISAYRTKPR